MQYNEYENQHKVVGAAGSAVGTVVSPGLDCRGMEQVTLSLITGVITATGTLDVEVEHSDDNGVGDAYATLTGAVVPQQLNADDDTLILGKIKVNTSAPTAVKRWLRISGVVGTDTADYGCTLAASNLSGLVPVTGNPALTFNVNDVSA